MLIKLIKTQLFITTIYNISGMAPGTLVLTSVLSRNFHYLVDTSVVIIESSSAY